MQQASFPPRAPFPGMQPQGSGFAPFAAGQPQAYAQGSMQQQPQAQQQAFPGQQQFPRGPGGMQAPVQSQFGPSGAARGPGQPQGGISAAAGPGGAPGFPGGMGPRPGMGGPGMGGGLMPGQGIPQQQQLQQPIGGAAGVRPAFGPGPGAAPVGGGFGPGQPTGPGAFPRPQQQAQPQQQQQQQMGLQGQPQAAPMINAGVGAPRPMAGGMPQQPQQQGAPRAQFPNGPQQQMQQPGLQPGAAGMQPRGPGMLQPQQQQQQNAFGQPPGPQQVQAQQQPFSQQAAPNAFGAAGPRGIPSQQLAPGQAPMQQPQQQQAMKPGPFQQQQPPQQQPMQMMPPPQSMAGPRPSMPGGPPSMMMSPPPAQPGPARGGPSPFGAAGMPQQGPSGSPFGQPQQGPQQGPSGSPFGMMGGRPPLGGPPVPNQSPLLQQQGQGQMAPPQQQGQQQQQQQQPGSGFAQFSAPHPSGSANGAPMMGMMGSPPPPTGGPAQAGMMMGMQATPGGPGGGPLMMGSLGGSTLAPSSQPLVAEVDEAACCRPAYMAFTMGAMPVNAGVAAKSGLPFGLTVHPLAEGPGSLGKGGIPIVNFGAAGVIRCKRCRAYINPFAKFAEGGRRWRCNLCTYVNDVPPAYYSPTDAEGRRVDISQRPELSQGSVEFIAPVEYMIRPPQAPVYVFVMDVSFGAVSTGMLATAVQAIKGSLDLLPGDERTQVGFVTYDAAVHFYSFKAGLHAPQMLVVPDIDELFMPVPEELLVNLSEGRVLVDQLLSALPGMFASTRTMESCLGPALDAAYNVMQHIGGKMVVLQSCLPSVGVGKLKPREAPKMLGSEKEHTLLAPDPGEDGSFYKTKAVDFSRQQISVDMFLFAPTYTDVATLGALSRYTAGQVYFYPAFNAGADGERFARDLSRDLLRTTGFEAVMRIRCTKGVNITNFYGNFFIRGTDLLALPNASNDTAFNVELSHEEPLAPGSVVAVQAALLYTTSTGERRIAVHTLAKPVTSVLADLFRSVDADAVANMLAKVALDHALRHGIHMARRFLHRSIVDLVRAYRAASTGGGAMGGGGGMTMSLGGGPMSSTRPGMMLGAGPPGGPGVPAGAASDPSTMLPEHLSLLPLYALGLQKCTLYRGGDVIRSDERASLVYRMLTMPTSASRLYIYPRLYSLHDMDDAAGRPDGSAGAAPGALRLPTVLNLSAERLAQGGVLLLDNGVELYLWVSRAAQPPLLSALFGVPSLEGVDPGALSLPVLGNDYNARVNALVAHLRDGATQAQKLRVVRDGAGDANEARFYMHLIEDRQQFTGGAVSYAEYIHVVLQESQQSSAMGGGGGGAGGQGR